MSFGKTLNNVNKFLLEIKRCVKSIQVDAPFEKCDWTFISGIAGIDEEANQVTVLDAVKDLKNKAIVLENFDFFIENPTIVQTFLNNYELYKSNQVCLVIVGNSATFIWQDKMITPRGYSDKYQFD